MGVPAGRWIPQIEPLITMQLETFVVVNNYRQNDWRPMVFTTKVWTTWTKLVDERKEWMAMPGVSTQGPNRAQSLFLFGNWWRIVFFAGRRKVFQRWTNGYPRRCRLLTLKIHPQDHDLVIGTFGRAFYILDDISDLSREIAANRNILEKIAVYNTRCHTGSI